MSFTTSNGVRAIQSGLPMPVRKLPEKLFPPLLVTTLMTPPEKRPYSAEMPDVSTWVSSIASSMNKLFDVPNTLSFVSTPSIRNTLS